MWYADGMRKPKVLVVDDSKTTRQTVKFTILQLGGEVFEAENGQEALQVIEKHPDLSLIFCDIQMPVMSGLEMLKIVQEKGLCSCPAVMLTALGHRETVDEARKYGVKGFLVKPASRLDLAKVYIYYVDSTADISQITDD